MKDGDYIVAINEQDVKWSPHDQVVTLIKKSGNALKLRLVTPLDKKEMKNTAEQLKLRGSSSPTSCASSTSGHSSGGVSGALQSFSHQSGGDLSSSPASSVTSGSTRSNKASSTEGSGSKKTHLNPLVNGNTSWNPFRKSGSSGGPPARLVNENIIMR